MKKLLFLFLAAVLVLTACGTAAPKLDRPGWTLFWHDEFDGQTIDTTKWAFDKGGSGWGNAEMEYYTDRPENAQLVNGNLVITARSEPYEGLMYTSARLRTAGLFQFTYGRVEARMKLPSGQGIWPAFWMLGTGANWPYAGEIDIMEYIGKTPDTLYETVHGPGYSGAHGITTHTVLTADTLKKDFHVYAVDWEPNDIRWYIDDKQVFEVTPDNLPQGTKWVYDHPFTLLLNLAVGGGWPGYPDSTTVFPQQLVVDYVRIYQKAGATPANP